MILPKTLFDKYLTEFDELISQGKDILQMMSGSCHDPSIILGWKTKCIVLLEKILPKKSNNQIVINEFQRLDYLDTCSNTYLLESCIRKLAAIREYFEEGFLGDLAIQIESAIAADYMGQAEQLLNEGSNGKYNHVPAAVLSGAVLEKALRTLCSKQTPPISKVNAKGEPLTLNPLIDGLKKGGVFNEQTAKQLRAWADIRNKAAHGEFDQFTRSDVETMIKGIKNFLETYMI